LSRFIVDVKQVLDTQVMQVLEVIEELVLQCAFLELKGRWCTH